MNLPERGMFGNRWFFYSVLFLLFIEGTILYLVLR